MDALEFLKERKRTCYLYDECDKCPEERGLCAKCRREFWMQEVE